MAATQGQATRPREHLGLLFALVLVLCLWLASHVGRDPGAPHPVAEVKNGRNEEQPSEPTDTERGPTRPDHSHAAFKERVEERQAMVAQQIEARQVKDPNVLRAMRTVPRHAFVPAGQRRRAYADSPLPIGEGQTISQPYIVAFMTEALALDPNATVLEIGTGSGYQAAVCAEIAKEVYTIEIVDAPAKTAAQTLKELGYRNVFTKAGDGYYGWPEKAPFDAIIGTAAAERIPPPLLEQLKKDGRMILPCEGAGGFQYLVLVTKDAEGRIHRKNVLPVLFVPMTGQVQKPAKTE
ncbi:MAG: protein-L-isoaspartate(D-aspartate) O-methyltransferase [Sedimentisphaerales bacterium]|nr:protein-L-isoaspartate(D-aspartate) O-methyltransferase [Sedimentisphaerales bacterium]